MQDRVPTKILANGAIRYEDFDANGNSLGYRWTKRADEPTQEGTPLNKGNLLSDATSMATGGSETVNDALYYTAILAASKKGFSAFELIQRGLI